MTILKYTLKYNYVNVKYNDLDYSVILCILMIIYIYVWYLKI